MCSRSTTTRRLTLASCGERPRRWSLPCISVRYILMHPRQEIRGTSISCPVMTLRRKSFRCILLGLRLLSTWKQLAGCWTWRRARGCFSRRTSGSVYLRRKRTFGLCTVGSGLFQTSRRRPRHICREIGENFQLRRECHHLARVWDARGDIAPISHSTRGAFEVFNADAFVCHDLDDPRPALERVAE